VVKDTLFYSYDEGISWNNMILPPQNNDLEIFFNNKRLVFSQNSKPIYSMNNFNGIIDTIQTTLNSQRFIGVYNDSVFVASDSNNGYCAIYFMDYINATHAIQVTPNISNLNVDVTNVNSFNRGFPNKLKLSVANSGSLSQDGTVFLTLDTNLIFYNALPAPTTINGNI
jgi:hypothetical protein